MLSKYHFAEYWNLPDNSKYCTKLIKADLQYKNVSGLWETWSSKKKKKRILLWDQPLFSLCSRPVKKSSQTKGSEIIQISREICIHKFLKGKPKPGKADSDSDSTSKTKSDQPSIIFGIKNICVYFFFLKHHMSMISTFSSGSDF